MFEILLCLTTRLLFILIPKPLFFPENNLRLF